MHQPRLAITMGDPLGVGPETIIGAWSDSSVHQICHPLVVGHAQILRRAAKLSGSAIEVVEIDDPEDATPSPALLPCLNVVEPTVLDAAPATVDPRGGQAAYDALLRAAELALDGRVDGMTTAPLHKAALWQAGHHYPGHTELLAKLCGVDDFAMMLYLDEATLPPDRRSARSTAGLGVVHVTLHMALRDVFAALSESQVLAKVRLAHNAMRHLSCARPRVGVCALNPHAGESGLFGDEEHTIIRPAVQQASSEGIDAEGPLPADTLLSRSYRGEFDAVVAMYHDQGHIALKLSGMHRAVNITLGLPIVRTSVAHGTAMDIAWQGRADHRGMVEAIRAAAGLATARTADELATVAMRDNASDVSAPHGHRHGLPVV